MIYPLNNSRKDFYFDELIDLHQILDEHEHTTKFLNGSGVRLDGKEYFADEDYHFDYIGARKLKFKEYAQLFGVFNNSRAREHTERNPRADCLYPGLYVTVVNGDVIEACHKNRAGLFIEEGGAQGLALEGLFIESTMLRKQRTPPLLGTVAFGLCAIQAFLIGLDKIELVAAGGVGYNKKYYGYSVWPKFGFNAPLYEGEFRDDHVPEFIGCATVLDAVEVDEMLWALHGSQRLMTFDLGPGSRSWTKLLRYMDSKGLMGANRDDF